MRKLEREVEAVFTAAQVKSVLVAVSGGADSVALLAASVRVSGIIGLHVECANCNFHLRGDESDRDSRFVEDLCRRFGVRLHTLDYDVADYLRRHPSESTEMACRNLRYADFQRIAAERGLDRVAVAHNSDDDIETMLLNMLRGSGIRGLKGMDTDNGRVIRPLLGVSRQEIEDYLDEIGETFITDSSNLTDDYRRNYIRLEVIPMLERRWPGARKALGRTISIMKEECGIIDAHYCNRLEHLCPDSTTLLVYSQGVTAGTVFRFIEKFGGNPATAAEIAECLEKDFRERKWRLSERYTAVLERDRLVITDTLAQTPDPEFIWERLDVNENTIKEIKTNRSHAVAYFPGSESDYELRRPRKGDRMAPLGMKGTRLVSDIISDAHLDQKAKEAVRVLVRRRDGEIIWVSGLKRSRHDLVNENSANIWKVQFLCN